MTDAVTTNGAEPIIRLEAVNKWYGEFQVLDRTSTSRCARASAS